MASPDGGRHRSTGQWLSWHSLETGLLWMHSHNWFCRWTMSMIVCACCCRWLWSLYSRQKWMNCFFCGWAIQTLKLFFGIVYRRSFVVNLWHDLPVIWRQLSQSREMSVQLDNKLQSHQESVRRHHHICQQMCQVPGTVHVTLSVYVLAYLPTLVFSIFFLHLQKTFRRFAKRHGWKCGVFHCTVCSRMLWNCTRIFDKVKYSQICFNFYCFLSSDHAVCLPQELDFRVKNSTGLNLCIVLESHGTCRIIHAGK